MVTDAKTPPLWRRWGMRSTLFLGAIGFLVWAAPTVVGWTPLVSWLCSNAVRGLNGSVHVGSASLGWFSSVRLHGVELRDADDRTIVYISKIESDRSLLRLLWDRRDLGAFKIDRPTITLWFGKNDSNLEEVLAKSLQPATLTRTTEGPAPGPLPQMRLEIADGTLKLHDAVLGETWQIRSINASIMIFGDESRSMQVDIQGSTHDGTEAGGLKAEMLFEHLAQANCRATIKGRFTSFPIMLANVVVRRYSPETFILGSLQGNGSITAEWRDGKPHVEADGEWIANHFILVNPALADTLEIDRVRAPCTLRLEDRKLIIPHADLQCDFGSLKLHGEVDFGAAWRAAFAQPDFSLTADVHLAQLAMKLPRTMRLHRDLTLTSGELKVKCMSFLRDGAVVWQGHVHSTDVCGFKKNQLLAWTEPIALDFEARDLHQGVPQIDQLKCSARFLHVEASQAGDQFTLTADADLQQLAEPLGQFVDLDGVKLTGSAVGSLQVRRGEADTFVIRGDGQLKKLNLTWLTKHPWQEESVSVNLDAHGQIAANGARRIDAGAINVKLGADLISVALTEPITDLATGPWGVFKVRMDGDLTRWQQRARTWSTLLDDYQLAGQTDLHTQIRLSAHAIDFTDANLLAINFRCLGPGLWIQEPTLNLQTAARWDLKTGQIELTQTKIACPAGRADAASLTLDPATMAWRGGVNITGNLGQLRQWMRDPKGKPVEPMDGSLTGYFDLEASAAAIGGACDLTLKNFTRGNPASPTWREAEIKCVGRGTYDFAGDGLRLDRLAVTTAAFRADAKGTIANCTSSRNIDLAGTLAYDLERLGPQLRPLLGKDVKIAGKDARTFKLAGPLFPNGPSQTLAMSIGGPTVAESALSFRELTGQAGLHWTTLKAHGCEIGPAQVKAVLQQGWLQVFPIETSLNGGKLRLQPNLKLEPDPVEMIMLAGPVIDKAKITPAMCTGALGHAMPMLANVADADGLLSLSVEGGRIPLGAPHGQTGAEIKGTLILHHAKVGPNPLVRELCSLLKLPAPTGVVKECRVPFHMLNGKVHHSNLELTLGDITLRSSGAVGLDGSLALIIEMPIPPHLAAAAKLTPSQARQTLRIPIGGTLDHPRVDPSALESLTAVLGRSLLENQLNRLLQPKR